LFGEVLKEQIFDFASSLPNIHSFLKQWINFKSTKQGWKSRLHQTWTPFRRRRNGDRQACQKLGRNEWGRRREAGDETVSRIRIRNLGDEMMT